MFFVLSKVFGYLILPFTIICILFVISVLVRNTRWKKRFFWTAFCLLMFLSNEFISNEVMRAWEVKPRAFKDMRKYKLGIVLTGATNVHMTNPNDRVYFTRGADRVTHTIQLYKLGIIEKILISGGTGTLVSGTEPEANKFQQVMVLAGVPADDIIIENQTMNTAESAIEVQKLLKQFGFRQEDCLLITSAFHMRRSLAAYHKAGLDLESFSTDFYTHPRNFYFDTLFVPQLDAIGRWNKLAKEWVGIIAYKIAGYV
jgi:uncharacterized SAM-binding protein YcdF (DUF218 family)